MITIGILFVYSVGAGVKVFWLSVICGIIPLIFGVVFFFMPGRNGFYYFFLNVLFIRFFYPESPTYLVMRNQEAASTIKWLRGNQYDPTEEIVELQNENEEQKANNLSIIEVLGRKASIRGLVICFGLMFFQQVSGINAVIFYSNEIFETAGTGIADIATIIVGLMQVIATFVASLIVDRLGRRILLLLSDSIMALCTLLLGVYFFMQDRDKSSVENLGWLPIVSLCVFIVTFSIGFGPVPWYELI